jgi:putative ABC transport system permease protein
MSGALFDDLRHALRSLLRSPAFTAAAVLTLAIGIGANSAIFSVIDAVLLRPLPYDRPHELVQLFETIQHHELERSGASPGEFLAWRERNQVFARLAATHNRPANLTGSGDPEQLPSARVSIDYFPLLGLRAARGRLFLPEEEQPGKEDVAVLSHALWQRRFGGDPGAVGRTISLDGRTVTIVGLLPRGVRLPQNADLALPIAFTAADRDERGTHYLDVLGRLRQGVDRTKAQAGMDAVAAALAATLTAGTVPHGVRLVSLHEELVGEARPALRMLLGAVGFVLLIACANVAGLLVSRAATRQRDLAIRAALGATRARLVQHMMIEGVVLALCGGGLGLLLALWGVDLLPRLIPGGLPQPAGEIGIDRTVLLFTFGVALASGLLVGLLPALHGGRTLPHQALQAGGRGLTESARRQRLRGVLVAAEMALTLVLLVGASLLMRSFLRLRAIDPGFTSARRIVADLSLPVAKYPDPPRIAAFYDALLERLAALPGVEAAGAVNVLPLSGSNTSSNISIEGEDDETTRRRPNANRRSVSPDYFRALGMRVVKGRPFSARDTAASQPVVIINEALAERRFPPGEAIGRRLRLGAGNANTNPWLEVVGIVADVRHAALEIAPSEEMYLPCAQRPSGEMTLVLGGRGDTTALASSLRAAVRSIDPDQPLAGVRPMDEIVDESLAPRRAALILLGAFASIAVLLAAVGLYGLIAYSVTQRTQEIGVRMALGAEAKDILAMVLRQGLRLAAAGVAAGLLAAFVLARLMSSLLFGIGAADPLTFLFVPFLLAAVAALASLLPARRATRVDPMTALRSE